MKGMTLALGLSLATGVIPAQAKYHVTPVGFATVEGLTNNLMPFYYPASVYMQIHDDMPAQPMFIRAISFRRDGFAGGPVGKWSALMTVRCSSAALRANAASTTFANNHGPDLLEVVSKVNVNFPASAVPATSPGNFINTIPFAAKPFLFKNSATARNGFCWELRIHSHTRSGSLVHDVAQFKPTWSQVTSSIGKGGMASGQTGSSYGYAYVTSKGGQVWLYGAQYRTGISTTTVKNMPLFIIGASDRMWGGVSLPLDLTPFGGTGNTLYTNILLLIPGANPTSSTGYYSWMADGLGIPQSPSLAGMTYFVQFASTDFGNTAFPFVFTNAQKVTVAAPTPPCPLCRIYGKPDTATTGSIGSQYGVITQFEYQ